MTREERRAAAADKLAAAVATLTTSDGWQRWLQARRNFRRYSFNNQLLIAVQRPEATRVMGFRAWLKFGRCVTKGEKAIHIFAPMQVKDRSGELDAEGKPRKRLIFGLVPVFDISQTHEIEVDDPLPLEPPALGETVGDNAAAKRAIETLIDWACNDHGLALNVDYTVDEGQSYGGFFDKDNSRVVIVDRGTEVERLRVLVHELAHALGVNYDTHDRGDAEVIVDAATAIVLDGLGMEVADQVSYIAGWARGKDIAVHLKTVDGIARELEDVLHGKPEPANGPEALDDGALEKTAC